MDYTVYQKVTLFVLATATTLIGAFMAGIRIRKGGAGKVLRSTRDMMTVAFFSLGFPAFITVFFADVPDYVVYLSFCLDTVSYTLLSFAAFQMASDKPVGENRRLVVSAVILALLAFSVFIVYMEGEMPLALRILLSLIYALIACYMAYIFRSGSKAGKSPVRNWAAASFYSTLFMGFFSGMILTSPLMVKNLFSDAVIFIYTLLNVGYVISFSNRVYYPSYSGNKVRMPVGEDVLDEKKASVLKGRLDSWVENKCYLQDDAIEDVVSALGTDLDFFRQYFRLRMPSDFRTWRISLRVEYAKKLINEEPSISMNVLSGKSGFVSRSNFYHYFKKITGETPAEYKSRVCGEE
ncbi:MAG: AraC family transcriptional regulator [Bacteroidetes bacterium]|uniref:AraC family transcriptional regulator n=1 Tax=Candidatus Merdivivens pullicola TaxID=2840872 RepID=A0A9D9NGW1_9BACT|nr:AraC family transcriptional regulator [Candidatus Merdivivens pullicola]